MSITRREFCESTAAVTLAAAAGISLWPGLMREAAAQEPSVVELMKAGPLPEMTLGAENAPVTMIEYASMTCSHCARFAVDTFPELKKRYIDTGKVYFIFREFPLDPLAAAGFMLARCSGDGDKNRFFAMVDTLFHKHSEWVVQQPVPKLLAIAKQAGFTEESFKACLSNQTLLDKIESVRLHANEKFAITSTPTFYINGEKHPGALTIDQVEKIIQPYLKGT